MNLQKFGKPHLKKCMIVVSIILPFVVPLVTSDSYKLNLSIIIAYNITFALCIYIVLMTGQLNIGGAGFLAVGSYASTLLVMKLGFPFWPAFFLAGIISASFALLLGLPTLKMVKGVYFAILTIAFGEVVRFVIINFENPFGGAKGIGNIPPPSGIEILGYKILFVSQGIFNHGAFYIVMLLLMMATVLTTYRIQHSRLGMILTSIGDCSILAESVGISITKYRVFAFCIGSFFCGLAGSLYTHYLAFVSPEYFTTDVSIFGLIFVLVGGPRNLLGPILGVLALSILPEFIKAYQIYVPFLVGSILVAVTLFMPEGLIGLLTSNRRPSG